jgi:hypothetical protein
MKPLELYCLVVATIAISELEDRLDALSLTESKNCDSARGRLGEISRYQIFPKIWRQFHRKVGKNDWLNQKIARRVARQIAISRILAFVVGVGRRPSHQEFYALWRIPSFFRRVDWNYNEVPCSIQETANWFAQKIEGEHCHQLGRSNEKMERTSN